MWFFGEKTLEKILYEKKNVFLEFWKSYIQIFENLFPNIGEFIFEIFYVVHVIWEKLWLIPYSLDLNFSSSREKGGPFGTCKNSYAIIKPKSKTKNVPFAAKNYSKSPTVPKEAKGCQKNFLTSTECQI